jgi:hypothetical protein
MVHSSTLTITTDGECLTCSGFSLTKIVLLGSFEFIADCFGGLSLSTKGIDSGAILMGTTCSGSPLLRAMIKDSTDEFYMALSKEGSSDLSASRRHSTGASLAPIATTPWLENTAAIQTMTIVSPWTLAPWTETKPHLERWHAFQEGQRA